MRKKEQRLWDRMRRALTGKVRLERIENVVSVGTPDLLCLANGKTSMVELKAVEDWPARATTRVLGSQGLSVDQKNWHHDWTRNGGTSFIIIGVGKIEVFAMEGRWADFVNDFAQEQLRQNSSAIGWDDISKLLGANK